MYYVLPDPSQPLLNGSMRGLGTRLMVAAVLFLMYRVRLPTAERHLAIALGKRYTAEEAQKAGIINEVSTLEKLEKSAISAANRLAGEGLDRQTLTAIKRDMYYDVYRILSEPVRFYSQL